MAWSLQNPACLTHPYTWICVSVEARGKIIQKSLVIQPRSAVEVTVSIVGQHWHIMSFGICMIFCDTFWDDHVRSCSQSVLTPDYNKSLHVVSYSKPECLFIVMRFLMWFSLAWSASCSKITQTTRSLSKLNSPSGASLGCVARSSTWGTWKTRNGMQWWSLPLSIPNADHTIAQDKNDPYTTWPALNTIVIYWSPIHEISWKITCNFRI